MSGVVGVCSGGCGGREATGCPGLGSGRDIRASAAQFAGGLSMVTGVGLME